MYINSKYTNNEVCDTDSRDVFINLIMIIIIGRGGRKKKSEYTAALVTTTRRNVPRIHKICYSCLLVRETKSNCQ
jgi:hypothetical protein